ncbi:MAG: hypothetical protein IKB98_07635 [Clostridia bacterium]|nr:hypothetical protein [Clostridia bacterium]
MKVSKDDIIQSLLVLAREEFEGELKVEDEKLLISFFNGQKFEVSVKEI